MKNTILELGWLAGCYVLAISATRVLLGAWVRPWGMVDIQMHNTYFVLPVWLLTGPLFLFIATLTTGIRAILTRFRRRATNVVLAGLVVLSLLLAAVPGFWLWQGLRREHTGF